MGQIYRRVTYCYFDDPRPQLWCNLHQKDVKERIVQKFRYLRERIHLKKLYMESSYISLIFN